jgi:hypothetical protein
VTARLAAALRAAADGLHAGEAAAELIISHDRFLHRDDFTRYVHAGTSISDGATLMAWIGRDDAITALNHGRIPASSGETSILRIAASLAGGCQADLRDTITGLDHRNLNLVTTAIRHTAGHRP